MMWWFENWPMRITQSWLLVLLVLSAIGACFTFYLLFWGPQCGRFCHAHRWAGTVSGMLVCTAFFQFGTTRWMAQVEAVYLNEKRFPYGPPSVITRAIIDHPDYPVASALRHFLFYDPTFAAMLGFGAGVFAILSYWID